MHDPPMALQLPHPFPITGFVVLIDASVHFAWRRPTPLRVPFLITTRGSFLRNRWMGIALVAKSRVDGLAGNGARWNGRKALFMRAKNCTRKIRKLCTKVSEVDWNAMLCSRDGEKHDGKRTYTPRRTHPNRPPAARNRAVERSMGVICVYTDT